MSIPRVNSTSSELNDFAETEDGQKIYNVSLGNFLSKDRLIECYPGFQIQINEVDQLG